MDTMNVLITMKDATPLNEEENEEDGGDETSSESVSCGWLEFEVSKLTWMRGWFMLREGKLYAFDDETTTSAAQTQEEFEASLSAPFACIVYHPIDPDVLGGIISWRVQAANIAPLLCIPIECITLRAETKSMRKDAPFAFRLDIADVSTVSGSVLSANTKLKSKIVINPIDGETKTLWTEAIERSYNARFSSHAGWLELEVVNGKVTTWEPRWVDVNEKRMSIYRGSSMGGDDTPRGTDVRVLDYEVPIHSCTYSETTKTKRPDAPHCFRVDVTLSR